MKQYFIAVILILLAILFGGCISDSSVKQRLAVTNYCDSAEDCVNIGSYCPFGCHILVNKKEADALLNLIDLYYSSESSGPVCIYECTAPGKISCKNRKCIMEPRDLKCDWSPGNCEMLIEEGYFWSPATQECTFFPKGSGCSPPPFKTKSECTSLCNGWTPDQD
ncbi:MAG: hypothetical protein JW772_04830 [Candidatus Diapherotrites archaeon]|nr:hypothetical protein [Candidatus Diapherotrites archaeon]